MTDFDHLINSDTITAAQANLDKVTARRSAASWALTNAQTAFNEAKRASNAALDGSSGVDPMEAQTKLDAAAKVLDVATRQGPAVENAIRRANDELTTAIGQAHQPVMKAAVMALIGACEDADAARAQLTSATDRFHACGAAIRLTATKGAAFTGERLDHGSPSQTKMDGVFAIPTVQEMRRRVTDASGWWPGLNPDGTVKGAI